MADPLTILGAAVGVISLMTQTLDECIIAYQYYAKAVNMPDEYRYCKIRLQMEQQRFLNFGLEAGVLYIDETLYESLRIDSGFDDQGEPDTDLVAMLFPPLNDSDRASSLVSHGTKHPRLRSLRKAVHGIIQTGKNLRTIALEPKPLVWASVDKSSFESLVGKLGDLNLFLISLLDSTRIERLQLTMDTSYNEILQICDDLKDLSGLIKALHNEAESDGSLGAAILHDNPIMQPFLRETEAQRQKKNYLKKLTEVKIQYKRIGDQMGVETTTSGRKPLDLSQFQFNSPHIQVLKGIFPEGDIIATYEGRHVWIEGSSFDSNLPHTNSANPRPED
ncbi:hypothetical protein N7493_006016 [Penicillium malachiteum]|uniref:Prion-inhibition and propagation HeLo domain-containing protein n=1 Tax=Penicillium malachiteum TaxID=1324776 RepID=A0AAD6MW05_9EURO|nr:hypothetical protein N7493_006016 [Penicillium malachiteum]